MQEWMNFETRVKKKIPEVMKFVEKKMVKEKMSSYCEEENIERFGFWCEDLNIDKEKGIIVSESEVHMLGDDIYTAIDFVEDLVKSIPDARFNGNVSHAYCRRQQ